MAEIRTTKWTGIDTAERNRERIRRTGRTPNGHAVWTSREDQVVREFFPDYSRMRRLLRRRSRKAVEARACFLKLTRQNHYWTTNELNRLRRRWRDATREELINEFPRHPWASIRTKATRFGVRRRPRILKPTGKPMLDEIRRRATDLKISLSELDRICRTGTFFEKSSQCWEPRRNVWLPAIAALGGRVEIVWR